MHNAFATKALKYPWHTSRQRFFSTAAGAIDSVSAASLHYCITAISIGSETDQALRVTLVACGFAKPLVVLGTHDQELAVLRASVTMAMVEANIGAYAAVLMPNAQTGTSHVWPLILRKSGSCRMCHSPWR